MTTLEDYQSGLPSDAGCAELAAILETRRRYGMEVPDGA